MLGTRKGKTRSRRKRLNQGSNKSKIHGETRTGSKSKFFSCYSDEQQRSMQINKEARYSITECRSADKITQKILSLPNISRRSTVTDMTACVGGNVLSFSKSFQTVNAVELDPTRYEMLRHNVEEVVRRKNVKFHQGNGIDMVLGGAVRQDVVFVDPPWGGTNYLSANELMLYMTDGSNRRYNLGELTRELMNHARYVALKVPTNFALNDFCEIVSPYQVQVHTDLRKMKLLIIS
jgi:predicted RNA methylase